MKDVRSGSVDQDKTFILGWIWINVECLAREVETRVALLAPS